MAGIQHATDQHPWDTFDAPYTAARDSSFGSPRRGKRRHRVGEGRRGASTCRVHASPEWLGLRSGAWPQSHVRSAAAHCERGTSRAIASRGIVSRGAAVRMVAMLRSMPLDAALRLPSCLPSCRPRAECGRGGCPLPAPCGEALVARLCGGGSVEHARLVGGDHVLDVNECIFAAVLLEDL